MRVISKKALRLYGMKHSDSAIPLQDWYTKISYGQYNNLYQLRKTFPTADAVGKYTVFNIGGNKYRLITAIHYNTQTIYVRKIWTHAEYAKHQQDLIAGNL